MPAETYDMPQLGWTCFHCGETFTTPGSARDHFGARPDAAPGCLVRVSVGGERGLLMALRKAEDELAQLYRERAEDDTLLHRELYRLQSKHGDSLRVAEEAGYERGLSDARHVEPLTPQDHADLCRAARYLASNNDSDGVLPGEEADRIAAALFAIADRYAAVPSGVAPAEQAEPSAVVPLNVLARAREHVPYMGETWKALTHAMTRGVEGKKNG